MSESAFVFAVCGGREHLDRLRLAVALLRRATARRILVVTDPARNAGAMPHDDVLSLATDPTLTDAQAAIVLKTRVAEALPDGGPHAYLDSDMVAIGGEVDTLFDHFAPPLTFASDLPVPEATLRTFSAHAVDCPCAVESARLTRYFARLDGLTALHRAHDELRALADPALYRGARFDGERRRSKWWHGEARGGSADGSIRFEQEFREGAPVRTVYRFAGSAWRLEQTAGAPDRWHDGSGTLRWVAVADLPDGGFWEDEAGDSFRRLAGGAGEERWWYRAGDPRRRWTVSLRHDAGGFWADGEGGELGQCDHLAERLERRFGLTIADRRWVPWNGGLFLFDERSRELLADWRSRCLALFAEPGFRPRDQGALAATAWAHGLAGHPRLPQRFNTLVDRRAERGRKARLDGLRGAGIQFVHLIGGGLGEEDWPLGADLAAGLAAGLAIAPDSGLDRRRDERSRRGGDRA